MNYFSPLDPEAITVFRKYGFEPQIAYEVDGIPTWKIEIPDNHPSLRTPDLVECFIRGIMRFGALLTQRLKPPLFLPKKNEQIANMFDEERKECVVVARQRHILEYMLTNPATHETPELYCVDKREELLKILEAAERNGVTKIIYFVAPKISETIPLKDAVTIVKTAIEERMPGEARTKA